MRIWAGYIYFFMTALDALPPYVPNGKPAKLFRGTPDVHKFEEYTLGRAIHWSAYSSATVNIEIAKQFSGQGGVICHIDTRSGRDVSPYSAICREDEVILNPNTKFHVSSELEKEPDGYWHVYISEAAKEETLIS
jgi:hypothetical protein